jgi:GTPase SAR1 family protein
VVPRLENLLTGATEVLASIPSTVLGISLAEAETALHRVVAARERMANPLTIAVMGEFSAGKSTFVNALLGQEIAPVGVLPTTTTINVFRHGTGKNAHVHYRDGRVATFAKSEVTAFLNELDDHEANRIHHVEIEHERTRMGDAAVVDTPGLNALDEVHEQVARGFVDEADAIVWVFSATRSGAGTEAGMLHELRRGGRQVLGVLNKIDTLDAGEVAELVAYLKQQLGGVVIDMIPVCARDALAFRISSQPAGKDPFEAVEHALEQQFLARARELKRSVTTRQLREALALAKQTVERAIDELETRAKQAAATTRIEREDPQTVLARFSDDLRGGLLTADDVLTREGLALGLLQTGKGRRKGDLDELDATYLDRCFRAAALAGLQRALARTAERDPTVAEVLHHTYVPWAHGSLSALSELGFIKHTFEQHGKRIVDGEAAVKMAFRTALEPIATAWVEHARSLVDAVEHARQQAWRREASAPRAEALRLRTTILAAIDGLVQAAEGLEP